MGGHGGGVVGWVVVWLGYFTVDSNRAKYNRKGCVYKYTERPFENNGMNNSTLNKGGRGVSCGRRGDMGQTGKGIEQPGHEGMAGSYNILVRRFRGPK
jgi:hypothetical protein